MFIYKRGIEATILLTSEIQLNDNGHRSAGKIAMGKITKTERKHHTHRLNDWQMR